MAPDETRITDTPETGTFTPPSSGRALETAIWMRISTAAKKCATPAVLTLLAGIRRAEPSDSALDTWQKVVQQRKECHIVYRI